MRKLTALLAAAALVAVPASASATPAKPSAPSKDIVQTAVAAGQFKTLVKLVKSAGLAETLSGEGPFTVFAPTDKAFARVPRATLRALGRDKAALQRVLTYHVVSGRYRASRLIRLRSVSSLAGPPLHVRQRGRTVRVAGAKVIKANVVASNGVIHVIDRVLIPRSS